MSEDSLDISSMIQRNDSSRAFLAENRLLLLYSNLLILIIWIIRKRSESIKCKFNNSTLLVIRIKVQRNE